jgi:hypothetical protein
LVAPARRHGWPPATIGIGRLASSPAYVTSAATPAAGRGVARRSAVRAPPAAPLEVATTAAARRHAGGE